MPWKLIFVSSLTAQDTIFVTWLTDKQSDSPNIPYERAPQWKELEAEMMGT